MSNRYTIRPKAAFDLDEQAAYLATEAGNETAHRFLTAAGETFAMLANQPGMGWRLRLKRVSPGGVRVFRVSGFEKILVFYQPYPDYIDILRVVHGSRNLRVFVRREPLG